MPSVFTIKGNDEAPKKKKRKKKASDGKAYALGDCKTVTNSRTGCSVQLCKTGKGRTGWTFKRGTTKCPKK